MKRSIRGTAAAVMAAAIAVTGINTGGMTAAAESGDTAMGRYMESEIALPEGIQILHNGRVLDDGSLSILAMTADGTSVWKSSDNGSTWEEAFAIPEKYEDKYLCSGAISPEGTVFCDFAKDSDFTDDISVIFSKDGQPTELELEELDSYAWQVFFTEEEKLLVRGVGDQSALFDTKTGEQICNYNENENPVQFVQQAGNEVYVFGTEEVFVYDYQTGEEKTESVIKKEIDADKDNFMIYSVASYPLVMAKGTEEGEVYYCNSKGIFRYMQGGSVVEQLVDGKLNSLAKPSVSLQKMQVTEDGSLLVFASDSGEFKIFCYTYEADVPTVPDKELHIYSLNENADVQQAASMFQNQNPEYYVNLEIGISGEDAVTASDALRTLNTEIMAGNGPDILILDGMPVDSYIEKGVLKDLRDIYGEIVQSEGLYENIAGTYARDESIYAIPTRFKMPVLQGEASILEKITDLASLADAAQQLRQEDTAISMIVSAGNIYWFLREFYTACSPAMVTEDGEFNSEAVKDFITQIKEIFELNQYDESEEEYRYIYMGSTDDYGYDLTTVTGSYNFLAGQCKLDEINLSSGNSLGDAATLNDQENLDYILAPYTGQNVFVPSTVAGISSKSTQTEGAEKFVKFLLSEVPQSSNQGGGLPVNKKAMEEEIPQAGVGLGSSGWSTIDEEGNRVDIMFDTYGPSEEEKEKFMSMVETLDTPSLTDAVMEELILEQAGKCVAGEISVEEAVSTINQKMSLYLAE
ncbi:MAG: extracellular solute-binding protein [Eubacteriales bacterium]|nr:extracellular solute-binding protein [Eubacteriales bacterium]